MTTQQGDVLLYQTFNGGDINVSGGLVEMSGGLETAAYLSLFGGNEDDDGSVDNTLGWWANLNETNAALRYRSETQHLLQSLPLTTANLRRVEDGARRDLAWFLEVGAASEVDAQASIPALNTLKLVVSINAFGDESSFEFVENWKARIT